MNKQLFLKLKRIIVLHEIKTVETLEDVASSIGISNEELLENREKISEVVKTLNDGVRSMPRNSSVKIS